jgi:hypothetical protein
MRGMCYFFLVCLIIFVGCNPPNIRTITWKDGAQAYVVMDSVDNLCYSRAGERCSKGYTLLQEKTISESEATCELIFRCK